MTVAVRPVASRAERRTFRDLPTRLHGETPAFVPMLDAAFARLFSRKSPFWAAARSREWLAWRDGEAVGRIGACFDPALAERAAGTGAVGFFDATDDAAVARPLFDAAAAWLRAEDCRTARGPLNYSIHDTAGVLVEGFDTPPTIDTTWNPPYYDGLWRGAGFVGAQDMIGVQAAVKTHGPERGRRFAERARRRGVLVRPLDRKRFDAEVEAIRAVYNRAWDANWGHVPIPADEFAYKAQDLKMVLDPDLVRIAEVDGRVVGFLLGLPDLNVAIRRSRGRLLPWGWWRLLRARRTCDRCRIVALGVEPGYRVRGVEIAMLMDSYTTFGERYRWTEASWVLADNAAMINGLAVHGYTPYKRWRMYEKPL